MIITESDRLLRRGLPLMLMLMLFHSGCSLAMLYHKPDTTPAPFPQKGANATDPINCCIAIAKRLAAEKLMYSHKPADNRDCSGIFHRLLDRLEHECLDIERPPISTYRNSRDIARWYADRGGFTIVTSPITSDYLIKPGMIMFYGVKNKRYRNLKLNTALAEIRHLGVVIAVQRASNGTVESYQLFHGRSNNKPAAITNFHVRRPENDNYPPFGNGTQQWIACAPITPQALADASLSSILSLP